MFVINQMLVHLYYILRFCLKGLSRYGFSEKFIKLASEKFLNAGSYQGLKQNIGL